MLLPDNVHPELCIYYNGYVVLESLKGNRKQHILELFENVRKKNDMSFSVFVLSLDWLYLIDAAKISEDGSVHLCF